MEPTQAALDLLGLRAALFTPDGQRLTPWHRITTLDGIDIDPPAGHPLGYARIVDGQGHEHGLLELNGPQRGPGDVVHVDIVAIELDDDAPRLGGDH